jgi:positive regulator of sigma E activity
MEQKMAKKKGRVIEISQDGWARVITERGDACNSCEASPFCHSIADCARLETNVLNKAGAGVGDLVTISLSSKMVFKGALILYIVPVAGLLSQSAKVQKPAYTGNNTHNKAQDKDLSIMNWM